MMALFEFHTIFYLPTPCYVFIDLSLDVSNLLPLFEVVPFPLEWITYGIIFMTALDLNSKNQETSQVMLMMVMIIKSTTQYQIFT